MSRKCTQMAKMYFHVFQKTVPSLVCDCHRSIHMLLSKAASHSLSHKTSLKSNHSSCILLPSYPTYSTYLHRLSVVRYVGFQGLFLQRIQWIMVYWPWTIHTAVSTFLSETVGLPCSRCYSLVFSLLFWKDNKTPYKKCCCRVVICL